MKWLSLILLFIAAPAWAQQAADCSFTATSSAAAAVTFPTSGGTGNARPTSYLEICNSHASQTIGLNWVGGTAAIGSSGTLTVPAGSCKKWDSAVDGFVPNAISQIGSGAGTTATCAYR